MAESWAWISAVLPPDASTNKPRVLPLLPLQKKNGHPTVFPMVPGITETVEHTSFHCQRYDVARKGIRRRLVRAIVPEDVQRILFGDERSNAIGNRTIRENIASRERETRAIFMQCWKRYLKGRRRMSEGDRLKERQPQPSTGEEEEDRDDAGTAQGKLAWQLKLMVKLHVNVLTCKL